MMQWLIMLVVQLFKEYVSIETEVSTVETGLEVNSNLDDINHQYKWLF